MSRPTFSAASIILCLFMCLFSIGKASAFVLSLYPTIDGTRQIRRNESTGSTPTSSTYYSTFSTTLRSSYDYSWSRSPFGSFTSTSLSNDDFAMEFPIAFLGGMQIKSAILRWHEVEDLAPSPNVHKLYVRAGDGVISGSDFANFPATSIVVSNHAIDEFRTFDITSAIQQLTSSSALFASITVIGSSPIDYSSTYGRSSVIFPYVISSRRETNSNYWPWLTVSVVPEVHPSIMLAMALFTAGLIRYFCWARRSEACPCGSV
jgi:hypothetical protein